MDALIREVLGQSRAIAEDVQRRLGVRMRTATVEQVAPLRIRYDGEAAASVVSPRTVVVPSVGDRVVVAKSRGQATILGVLGQPQEPVWQPLILASSVSVMSGIPPAYYVQRDGQVVFRGRAQRTNGGNFPVGGSPTYIARAPADLEWDGTYSCAITGTGGVPVRMDAGAGGTGNRELFVLGQQSYSWVDFSGMRAWIKK